MPRKPKKDPKQQVSGKPPKKPDEKPDDDLATDQSRPADLDGDDEVGKTDEKDE
jgi:hypothetical protein